MALVLFALLCHTQTKQTEPSCFVQPQGLVLVLLLEPEPEPHDECRKYDL